MTDNAAFLSNIGTRAVSIDLAAAIAGMAEQTLQAWRMQGGGFLERGRFVIRPNPADPQGWLVTESSR